MDSDEFLSHFENEGLTFLAEYLQVNVAIAVDIFFPTGPTRKGVKELYSLVWEKFGYEKRSHNYLSRKLSAFHSFVNKGIIYEKPAGYQNLYEVYTTIKTYVIEKNEQIVEGIIDVDEILENVEKRTEEEFKELEIELDETKAKLKTMIEKYVECTKKCDEKDETIKTQSAQISVFENRLDYKDGIINTLKGQNYSLKEDLTKFTRQTREARRSRKRSFTEMATVLCEIAVESNARFAIDNAKREFYIRYNDAG